MQAAVDCFCYSNVAQGEQHSCWCYCYLGQVALFSWNGQLKVCVYACRTTTWSPLPWFTRRLMGRKAGLQGDVQHDVAIGKVFPWYCARRQPWFIQALVMPMLSAFCRWPQRHAPAATPLSSPAVEGTAATYRGPEVFRLTSHRCHPHTMSHSSL